MGAGAVAFLSAGKKIERRTRQDFLVDALPLKRYPMEEVIQTELENLTPTVSELCRKRAADFVDKNILDELESEGFFTRLSAKYGK